MDDQVEALDALKASLAALGAEVTAAPSARAALELLPTVKPHVIMADIAMPGTDGLALIQSIRQRERGLATPAIAVSAFSRQEQEASARQAGFQEYVQKPVFPDELVARVRHLVDHSGTAEIR